MNNYQKLIGIIEEIDELIDKRVNYKSPEFQAWRMKVERFLIQVFGENSHEYRDLHNRKFSTRTLYSSTPELDLINACKNDLLRVKAILSTYLEDLDETESNEINPSSIKPSCYKKIFIVHGHDGELKQTVARIIEKQGIEAVILSEQSNPGITIIEKLEKHSDVGAAICLFTNDDIGKANNEKDLKPRARQNVVFEAGYFMGYLGRDHVVMIADTDNEIPGDLGGMVYTSRNDWKISLCKDLKSMGYGIDFNKLF